MSYHRVNILDKLDRLQKVYGMLAALAEAIGVSRRSLPNWRSKLHTKYLKKALKFTKNASIANFK